MKIYGAGMAGLLAANMLRKYDPIVYEIRDALPNNHGALLRFRSDSVAQETGQRFRKVHVQKAISFEGSIIGSQSLYLSNMYSYKVTGRVLPRSIINLDDCTRYIAPPDFLEYLAKGINIQFGSPLKEPEPCISTIPMPALMGIVGWYPRPHFNFRSVVSLRTIIAEPIVEVYQTLYYPDVNIDYYRASITGNLLTIEYLDNVSDEAPFDGHVQTVLDDFGIVESYWGEIELKYQKFGKLSPINERERRSFIYGMTNQYNIYSVGRFATWRQILLDDVVKDIKIVERFIEDKTEYSQHLAIAKNG